jgi:transposase
LNVLKPHLRITVETLLAKGVSQHEISRRTGVDRKTIRRYRSNSPMATGSQAGEDQTPPPRPPASASSACEPHRAWIEAQVQLGRNAQAIYQDLVERFGFEHRYNSVKRFVRALKVRDPERFDVLESLPGEEAQVDFGQGALTLRANGKYRRPQLFVMTLKYSGKSFRKVVWKADQQSWARLHEEAFRTFGGSVAYVVLDNLKAGVIRPDLYEPELNAVYAALLAHYGVVADPCRVGDPNRKGTVENAIQHTQSTALKGRKFESIEEQNSWLSHWEERWAAPRIHGRKKRQVLAMFAEEQPALKPLPAERFRMFKQQTRTVDDAGLVQVNGAYYAALPAAPHSEVTVRIYEREIEILDQIGQVLRRHQSVGKGQFVMADEDRLFNPSRETARLLTKVHKIGPHSAALAREIFTRRGRPGQRAIYGLANLVRRYACADIEAACQKVLTLSTPSYQAVRRLLEQRAAATTDSASSTRALSQAGAGIRPIDDYQAFFEQHAESAASTSPKTQRNPQ